MQKPFVAISAEQLAAIASPGREAIIDAIVLIGPCSIAELAKTLKRSSHSLYYHVKALRDCGLLIETHRSNGKTRLTAYYDVPGRPFSVSFDLSTKARRDAVLSLARVRMHSALRGFERACRPEVATVEGPGRNLWATHIKGKLSKEGLAEVNALLAELVDLLGTKVEDTTSDKQIYEFTFALCPNSTEGSDE